MNQSVKQAIFNWPNQQNIKPFCQLFIKLADKGKSHEIIEKIKCIFFLILLTAVQTTDNFNFKFSNAPNKSRSTFN